MVSGSRRKAREAALKVLFQIDLSGKKADEALSTYWEHFDLEADGDEYAAVLVKGIASAQQELDDDIRKTSNRWRLERMAVVDRNVLRIGAYELKYSDDVPTRVILDEAIELGKRFGAEESGSFINGILDRLAQSHRSEDFESGGEPPSGGDS